MTTELELTSEHRHVVLSVVAEHLPPTTQVWVFGSRATGRARRYSDLDLAIDAGRRLTINETAILREAFDESDLPYRVDIVDWHAIDDRFRAIVSLDGVPLVVVAPDGSTPRAS